MMSEATTEAATVTTGREAAAVRRVFDEMAQRKRWKFHHIALLAFVIGVLLWAAEGVNLRPHAVVEAVPVIGEYFARMWPPKWGFSEVLWKPAIETIYIALWGSVLSTVIGLPLGILAARNVVASPLLRNGVKGILNLLRSISELIWAIFFVAAVGLGSGLGRDLVHGGTVLCDALCWRVFSICGCGCRSRRDRSP